jgi:hypothetical protein
MLSRTNRGSEPSSDLTLCSIRDSTPPRLVAGYSVVKIPVIYSKELLSKKDKDALRSIVWNTPAVRHIFHCSTAVFIINPYMNITVYDLRAYEDCKRRAVSARHLF